MRTGMSGTATLTMQMELAFGEHPLSVVRLTLICTMDRGGIVSRLHNFMEPECQERPPFHEKER